MLSELLWFRSAGSQHLSRSWCGCWSCVWQLLYSPLQCHYVANLTHWSHALPQNWWIENEVNDQMNFFPEKPGSSDRWLLDLWIPSILNLSVYIYGNLRPTILVLLSTVYKNEITERKGLACKTFESPSDICSLWNLTQGWFVFIGGSSSCDIYQCTSYNAPDLEHSPFCSGLSWTRKLCT